MISIDDLIKKRICGNNPFSLKNGKFVYVPVPLKKIEQDTEYNYFIILNY